MRRRITVAVLALCALMAVGAPTLQAKPLESKYQSLRAKVVHEHGPRAPGRNIVRDGVRTKHGTRSARKAEIAKSIEVFLNILSPPAPPPAPATSGLQSGVSPSASSTSSSAGGGCNGMSAESGSLGYNNDTHAGYIGCYQISAEHYASGGSCSGLGTDPAGQDQCAAIICHTEGAGAWTNPAGQNPCGRP